MTTIARSRIARFATTSTLVAALGLVAGCSSSVDHAEASVGDDGVHHGVLRTPSGDAPVTYVLKNGRPTIDGDVDLKFAGAAGGVASDGYALGSRDQLVGWGRLWPNGVVNYRYDANIPDDQRSTIEAAIAHYQAKTAVRFYHDTQSVYADHILFKDLGDGCHGYIGYQGGEQIVALQTSQCNTMDIAVHEIGHALGLLHEMNRPDRNQYVIIHWDNILKPEQFDPSLNSNGREVGDFDFSSIMLYKSITSDTTLARNTALPIITRLDGSTYPDPQPGNKGLSAGDVAAIRTLYDYVTVSPPDLSLIPGGPSATITFTANATPWADKHPIFQYALAGVPSGVIATPNDAYGTSYTLQALAGAALGSFSVTARASSGSEAHTTQLSVSIAPPPPAPPPPPVTLSIALSDTNASTLQGHSCGFSVTTSGTAGAVTLTASHLPYGLSAAFGANNGRVGDQLGAGFWATADAALGTFPVTITATANGVTASQVIAVEVDACQPITTCGTQCGTISNGCGGTLQCSACPKCKTGYTYDPDTGTCEADGPPQKCHGVCI